MITLNSESNLNLSRLVIYFIANVWVFFLQWYCATFILSIYWVAVDNVTFFFFNVNYMEVKAAWTICLDLFISFLGFQWNKKSPFSHHKYCALCNLKRRADNLLSFVYEYVKKCSILSFCFTLFIYFSFMSQNFVFFLCIVQVTCTVC